MVLKATVQKGSPEAAVPQSSVTWLPSCIKTKSLPSYIKDTSDFINRINETKSATKLQSFLRIFKC